MKFTSTLSVLAMVALTACVDDGASVGQPSVGSSSDLSSFEGTRAGQAEMGIQNLGYELVRTEGLTAYWFNRSTGACARVVTADGRYSSVDMLPSGDC
ncbi:hypothetical protein [Fluviibacterium sp. S390]|uniref:hypothetical protein n=1 Tax=Fluviibacterium sp. S390 TaxID=3415139 RepID=UPI003C7E2CCC